MVQEGRVICVYQLCLVLPMHLIGEMCYSLLIL